MTLFLVKKKKNNKEIHFLQFSRGFSGDVGKIISSVQRGKIVWELKSTFSTRETLVTADSIV